MGDPRTVKKSSDLRKKKKVKKAGSLKTCSDEGVVRKRGDNPLHSKGNRREDHSLKKKG